MDLPTKILENNDYLVWDLIEVENTSEKKVLIKYDNNDLGFVKEIHSNVFKKYQGNIRIRVHSFLGKEKVEKIFLDSSLKCN